ncbi:MAG: hypothetical protein ACYC6R_05945 [Anaerolineales bacterium]
MVSHQALLIMYSPKLFSLWYLTDTLEIKGSNQIVIKSDTAAMVDIEIRIGEVLDQ